MYESIAAQHAEQWRAIRDILGDDAAPIVEESLASDSQGLGIVSSNLHSAEGSDSSLAASFGAKAERGEKCTSSVRGDIVQESWLATSS
jgi:hypothetical protein